MGEGSVAPEDADAFAKQLAEASREVNYAAADAGFKTEKSAKTCTIKSGDYKPHDGQSISVNSVEARSFEGGEKGCAGYFVNFESHIPRIESRIVRSMLTALPTDKARTFLEKISGGDLLGSLIALGKSMGDIAGSFHRGAAVYRSGTEIFAASMEKCTKHRDPSYASGSQGYDQRWDTVYLAADCLGLSQANLFDSVSVDRTELPRRVDPAAFHALFRIARAACVGLPIEQTASDSNPTSRKSRATNCNAVVFEPKTQPLNFESKPEEPTTGQEQNSQQTQPPSAPRPDTLDPVGAILDP